MAWNVEHTDEFTEWWNELTDAQQEDITATVELLMEHGPNLPFPHSSILLIGGDKTGDSRFYGRMIPVADKLYDVHLDELRKEGLIR
jgi:hypothetical protein